MKLFTTLAGLLALCFSLQAQPYGLLTDLIPDPEVTTEQGQRALIDSPNPSFSWIVPSSNKPTYQKAYRILLSSSEELARKDNGDVWDSGKVKSSVSSAVLCPVRLEPDKEYYWKVMVWTNTQGASGYSAIKNFRTSPVFDGLFSYRPLVSENQSPVLVKTLKENHIFADFGKDAFSQISFSADSPCDCKALLRLGEALGQDGLVNREPGASIRYAEYEVDIRKGSHNYDITIRHDTRNHKPRETDNPYVSPIHMPDYMGEVYPFRYVEIEFDAPRPCSVTGFTRRFVHHPFDYDSAVFTSSDDILNQVWDLCKYSIKATSFCGIYVDGDRERIPYEADALINQLSHYGTDREYSMARRSVDFLINCGTWPTEWILQSVMMAWYDYLYTGDTRLVEKYYDVLKKKTLIQLRDDRGLISPATYPMTPEFFKSIRLNNKKMSDIIDWPRSGAFGIGKEEAGEADGYQLTDCNTVPNAYHYISLMYMARIADVLGHKEDASDFRSKAELTKQSINELFLDREKGYYRDGFASAVQHWAQHASMFPLAFGIVPEQYVPSVTDHIRSRGMACSVYGSQFLMDALYDGFDGDFALSLLNSTSDRSWYNMIRAGSTMTLESWDPRFKSNLDWNHAWGAAPANIIPRKLMGVEALEPGFSKIRVRPQPGTLRQASIVVPTIKGDVKCSLFNNGSYSLTVSIPGNTTAEIWYLCPGDQTRLCLNGKLKKARREGDFLIIETGSGVYSISKEQ